MGKAAVQSKTVIASLVAAFAALAPLVGYTISETDQAALRTVIESGLLVVSNAVAVVSAIVAIWGRFTARQQVSGIVHPVPAAPLTPE